MFYKPSLNLIVDGVLTFSEAITIDYDELYKLSYAYEKFIRERE